ncbi:hypothetical protein DFJ73DRAFT_853082 [Zopfochytrium polystomum]|nr:hypothetical protein DFJ73DRAFT_853082 [Zopfochytrium polystomum]
MVWGSICEHLPLVLSFFQILSISLSVCGGRTADVVTLRMTAPALMANVTVGGRRSISSGGNRGKVQCFYI